MKTWKRPTHRDKQDSEPRRMLKVSHLVIDTPGLFAGKSGKRVIVSQKGKTLYEIPLIHLRSITLSSTGTGISSDLITFCAQAQIPLCWISSRGVLDAEAHNPDSSSAALQIRQLEVSRDPFQTFKIAKSIIVGKIKNQINLIKYFGKYERGKNTYFQKSYSHMESAGKKILAEVGSLHPSGDWERIRGHLFSIEGRLASHYWDNVKALLKKKPVNFPGRLHQGATDKANCLLNYGYAILRSRVMIELHRSGLNPYISFLHAPRKGMATLSFDLMEIFRSQVVDRVVLAELRRNSNHHELDSGGLLTLQSRQRLIEKINLRLDTVEEFRGRKLKLGEIIREQSENLKRHIEGKAQYRPYVGKW